MCELLAISSRQASAVTYSLPEFAMNGSALRSNRSGWGIAFAGDKDALLIKEPEPAVASPWVDFIAQQKIESRCVIAHVRYATRGANTLENTHPFKRALAGHMQLFAHNGTLEGIEDRVVTETLSYEPLGETDSELAFCLLLSRLKPIWRAAEGHPTLDDRMAIFVKFAAEMATLGPANFLYFDGDTLFAHAHRRIYEEGGRHTEPKPPGLQIKNCQHCAAQPEYACRGLKIGLQDQRTIVLASVPLDEVEWEPLPEGTALALRNGEEILRERTL